jgi:ABC-type uncharacterized transport system ATPase subunit
MEPSGKSTGAVLRTEHLTKHYGTVPGLEDLSLEVSAGEVLGYLGPNGAGKTTTIRLLLGMIKPTGGRAEIFGLDTQHEKVAVHGSFLVEMLGSAIKVNHWVMDTSLLHHVALAPAVSPDWGIVGIYLAIGCAAACLGGWRFTQRDLQSS